MGKRSPRLNDFRSGEMTPGLGARSDLGAYSRGCLAMKNCMPLIEGGVERVPGTRFLRTVKQIEEGWSLKITRSGTGEGDVDSNPAGIDCGPTCYTFFADGASIELTAEADATEPPPSGSEFVAWSGDGTGSPLRTVIMNGDKVVNAEFKRVAIPTQYMYAWFKYDEGAGLTLIDYSPLAINGILETEWGDPTAKFWSVPGFGHNDNAISWLVTWARGYGRPSWSDRYVSMVGFIRPLAPDPGVLTSAAMWHGVGGEAN